MWTPISSVMVLTTDGSCAWTPIDDRLPHRAGQVLPQARVLAHHHVVDQLGQVGTEHVDDVLGDLVRLELGRTQQACPAWR